MIVNTDRSGEDVAEVNVTDSNASGGRLTIDSGGIVKNGYGGRTNNGTASGDEMDVYSGGIVNQNAVGGYSESGDVEINSIYIERGSGSKVQGSAYGGLTENGEATGNLARLSIGTVGGALYGGRGTTRAQQNETRIEGNSVDVTAKDVYGGYASTGDANASADHNLVRVSYDAKVNGSIYGGYSSGSAVGNSVNIVDITYNPGSNDADGIYGGYAEHADAEQNTVDISGGTFTNNSSGDAGIYAGYSKSGTAQENSLEITGGSLDVNVYGGYSENGWATRNTATVRSIGEMGSDTPVVERLYGGWGKEGAASNTARVSEGTVHHRAVGGSSEKTATNNILSVESKSTVGSGDVWDGAYGGYTGSDGTITSYNNLYIGGNSLIWGKAAGGYSEGSTMVQGNILSMDSGVVSGDAYGSYSKNGSVCDSSADIQGGTVKRSVYGGHSSGEAKNNFARLGADGSIEGALFGGYSVNDNATGNSVDVSGKVTYHSNVYPSGGVYGGYAASDSGKAENNFAILRVSGDVPELYGGYAQNSVSGNSIDIKGTVQYAYGGFSKTSSADNNFALLDSTGTVKNLYGGYGEGDVTNSSADVRGTVSGSAYGGRSYNGTASGDSITVSGTVSEDAYGGDSEFGGVQDSFAIVDSTGTVMNLYGGHGYGNVTGSSADVKGTVNESAYGGYSKNGDVQDSFAFVDRDGTVKNLYGGWASGDVTGSSADVKGTVRESAYGGYSKNGGVQNSFARVEEGNTSPNGSVLYLYGGFASGDVTNTSVDVKGTVEVNAYGGYSVNGGVQDSFARVDGKVAQYVFGGWASGDGEVTGSSVDVKGTVQGGYGGWSTNGGVQDSFALLESSGKVSGELVGGWGDGNVTGSSVDVKGTVNGDAVGGNSYNGGVENSFALLESSGKVSGDLVGGWGDGNVTGSSADVKGTVNESAYGGRSVNGTASGSIITVSGTVSKDAYGGYSANGGVENSFALLESSGKVSGDLVGGWASGNVTGSSADVKGTVSRDAYGGRSVNGTASGSIITVSGTVSRDAYGGYSENGSVQDSFAFLDSTGRVYMLYGGFVSDDGEVTGSSADVKGAVDNTAYGGYSENGSVQNSFALLEQGGTVKGFLIGGGASGDVTGSSADVKGTVYMRAYGGWSRNGTVSSSVTVSGTVNESASGGWSVNGTVSGSSVTVSGTVNESAYGGYSVNGDVQNSFARVEQGGTVKGTLAGGYASGDVSGSSADVKGTVNENAYGGFSANGSVQNSSVVLDSTGTVKNLYGGFASDDGEVTGSKAEMAGGSVTEDAYGGYSANGDAVGNVVTAENVSIGGSLYGGRSETGASRGNTVYFISGSVGGAIYGGGCVDAIENHTVISGDTGVDVYGGHATTGTARGNVTDVWADASANVYGGASDSGSAVDNVVNLYVPITGSVYGGRSGSGNSSGNRLNTYNLNTTARDINDTQIMNLASEGDVQADDVFLQSHVIVPSNGTVVNADAAGTVTLNPHESVYLIKGPISVASGGSLSIGTENLTEKAGVINDGISRSYKLKAYQRTTDSEGDYLRLTMASVYDDNGDGTGDGLAPQTESLVHAPLASMAMLNQGGDLIVDSFAEAEKAIDWAGVNGDVRIDGRKGFIPFVAAGGNKLREEVGSYVDIDGWNFNAGAAKLTRNNLLWGVFGEYGRTSYTGHLDSGQSANGNGHYTGGGVFARKKNPGGLYYEGSFRAGRVKNDYKSDSMIKPGEGAVHTEYDYKSDYYAAHVGIGVAQQVGRRNVLDYYLRWFYTHQDGFDAALSSGENYQFDDVESSRLRLGLRYSCVLNKYSTLYLGGAWQYEFEGDSKAMYAGYNTLVPSLNGSSGMFEFGWQVKPSERSPLTLDFGAAGWFGRQKGASFRFSARWDL
jgi:hypothetical protein